ncbi:MAG: alkaline phosphatase family protein [Actinomycetota bacterium]
MIRRRIPALLLLIAVACSEAALPGEPRVPEESPPGTGGTGPVASGPFVDAICGLPAIQALRVWRGYYPGRSGELQFVAKPFNFFGGWSHSGPAPYLQRIPMLFYGPGHVPALGPVDRGVTMADLAPTLARFLDFDFETADGSAMEQAILPDQAPPRLIFVLVLDGGGRNVLTAYPDAWPNTAELIRRGVWFDNATVGSSPSVTPAIHTTLGTGVFPRRHGLIDLRLLFDGRLVGPHTAGPQFLRAPTLADRYDQALDNEPVIAFVAPEGTLGMIGHGSFLEDADQDFALAQREGSWGLSEANQGFYDFPSYINQIGGLNEAARRLDVSDGRQDDAWLGLRVLDTPAQLQLTPAWTEYQTGVLREVIRREGLGDDDIPDLLFTNYKQIDKVGHEWSFPSVQMEAVVGALDRAVGDLVRTLNQEVGRGEWVLALTADHGVTPREDTTGGFRIDIGEMLNDISAAFDGDGDDRNVVSSVRVTQFWMNTDELAENGYSLEDVATFVMEYTKEQNVLDPNLLPEEERSETLFAAAFPGPVLEKNLPCLPPTNA